MKYAISTYGPTTCVGLLQEQGAQEDINLSHNLFDTYCDEHLYHGVLHFKSPKQFLRFLAYKCYFQITGNTFNKEKDFGFLRQAYREAKQIIKTQCQKSNFMWLAAQQNKNAHHNVNFCAEEEDHEC